MDVFLGRRPFFVRRVILIRKGVVTGHVVRFFSPKLVLGENMSTPLDLATAVQAAPTPPSNGSVNLPSFNFTYTMGRMDDSNQWDR